MTECLAVAAAVADRQGGWEGPVFGPAHTVVRRLAAAGHRALFVGGAVRDLCLGRPVHDVDVATSAPPEVVARLFPRTVMVGKNFGVVVVVLPGGSVEVATFRTDGGYADGRHPTVVGLADERGDVERRDFTVNALLLDPMTDMVIDHIGGLADLRAGVIRTVGDPRRRFAEDRLRVLRAIRFTARLGFVLADDCAAALRGQDLSALSRERVLQEWRGGLGDPGRSRWFDLLQEHGHRDACCPVLAPVAAICREAWTTGLAALPPASDWIPATALLAVTAGLGIDAWRGWLEAEPLSREERRRLGRLVDLSPAAFLAATPGGRRRMAVADGADLLTIWRAARDGADTSGRRAAATILAEILAEKPVAPEPFLTGDDCLAAGATGPRVGELLRAALDHQWAGKLTTREAALAWIHDEIARRG
jgi:hypothetical protein